MNFALNKALKKSRARWYDLTPHPVQLELIDAVPSGIRFPLVPAGRRSGKTERFKRFLVKQATKKVGPYFATAPTHEQAKKIFWDDLKLLSYSCVHFKKPSETQRIIYMNNGSEIHVFGLDKPERIEGIPWVGGGIDEFGNVKSNAWPENIYPSLNTFNPNDPDYRSWCWVFGVPEGLNHYFDMCRNAQAGLSSEYKVFTWHSADILSPLVIEEAKKTLSPRQFRQEYEASFESAGGRIYEDYSSYNQTNETIKKHEQILWMHDFNYTPMSSAIGVIRDGVYLYLLDEIVLTSAVARQTALEFVNKYKDHGNKSLKLFGDPAGRAGEIHGHMSDYVEIEQVLKSNGWNVERLVRKKAPAIVDRQNAVRAKIKNANESTTLFVNPATARYCDKGLATAQVMEGSAYQEKVTDYQHITTAIGYCVDYLWPVRRERENKDFRPSPTLNYWNKNNAV